MTNAAVSMLSFIGPGGPEFLLIVLALIMLFGAKDAPRILRKLNEWSFKLRNVADGFKRELMYGDLNPDPIFDDEDDPYAEDSEEDAEVPEEVPEEDEDGKEAEDARTP